MLKYYLTAAALQAASINSATKKIYRALGNSLGQRRRMKGPPPGNYFQRVKKNVSLCKHCGLFQGGKMLEIGTGWVHWEALTTRLFFDFEATLYDVWDNRQFDSMLRFLRSLEEALADGSLTVDGDTEKALRLIKRVCSLKTFDEVYDFLGFRYVLDPQGELGALPNEHFAVAISAGVLEHVAAASAPRIIQGMARVLVPGGNSIHDINIMDHLYLYDKSASPKQYLTYSDRAWKLLFENEVQYINRLQRSDWVRMFSEAGFDLIQETSTFEDVGKLPIDPKYGDLSERDRNCLVLDALFRKRK